MCKTLEIFVTNNQNTFLNVCIVGCVSARNETNEISSNINEFISSSFFLSSRFPNSFKFISDLFLGKFVPKLKFCKNTHKRFARYFYNPATNKLCYTLTTLDTPKNFLLVHRHTNRNKQNIEMVAQHPKISSGSWTHFSLLFVTFTGLTPNSVNILSNAWSSWPVIWLNLAFSELNSPSNSGWRSRWPSYRQTTSSALRCARWSMWYWTQRISRSSYVPLMELTWWVIVSIAECLRF